MKKRVSEKIGKIITYIVLILLAISIVVPVAWILIASVKENSEFYGSPWALPKGLYFDNYINAFVEANMADYIINSLFVTAMALILLLIIALPAAYVLSRFKFRSSKLLNIYLMAGLFINLSYITVPIFLMLVEGNKTMEAWCGIENIFLNNHFILALVYASTALPFTIFLLSSYFKTLPKDFEEAAYVDGASQFKTMISIMFPIAKPSIITVILFQFLAFWNEYILAMTIMTDELKQTLPVGLLNLMNAQRAAAQYGRLYAGLILALLPTLLLYILVQKHLIKGMTSGGVKG